MKKSLTLVFVLGLTACSTGPKKFPDQIEESIVDRTSDIRDCYVSQPANPPEKSGRVVIQFLIGADGKVSKAEVASTTLKDPIVEACVIKTIQSIRFPVPKSGDPTQVTYPFKFNYN